MKVKFPLRCTRCKAYINPYFRFDGTKTSGTCNICGMTFAIDGSTDSNNLNSSEILTEGIIDFEVSDKIFMRKRLDIIKVIIAIEVNRYMYETGIINIII